jgi:cobalt-zinc-cadmium efflux system membrane fusion protein
MFIGRARTHRPVTAAALLLAATTLAGCKAGAPTEDAKVAPPTATRVELTPKQLDAVEIVTVAAHAFSPERTAVGSIDFDEDRTVQVFPNYQGKIIQAFAQLGDEVTRGKPLYTIDSPDLIQAESTLIAAAGVADLDSKALERATHLHETKGIADKDYEQAVSDQMTAQAALEAARSAVRVFGKADAEINRMVAARRIDPALVVTSPVSGRVTARNAQPGLLVQPGNAPAPFAVSDTSTMWMIANVAETDSPLFHRGQPVQVKVAAYPDRDFSGTISVIAASVDPATHTVAVRSEIRDPKHELKPGMMAAFVIQTGAPVTATAAPLDAVVRDGDGSMNVWVTTDRRHFLRRTVKIGLQRDGFDEIVDGLRPGELVVNKGAVFLSNMLDASQAGDD